MSNRPFPLQRIYEHPEEIAPKAWGRWSLGSMSQSNKRILILLGVAVLVFAGSISLNLNTHRVYKARGGDAGVEAQVQKKIDQCFSDNPPPDPNANALRGSLAAKFGNNLDFKTQMKQLHLTRAQVLQAHRSDIDIWRNEITKNQMDTSSDGGGGMDLGQYIPTLFLFGIPLLIWYFIRSRRQEKEAKAWKRGGKGAHGSARWARRDEIITAPEPRWVIPLWCANDGTARPWEMRETRGFWAMAGLAALAPPEGDAVCTHFLLLGASGSGKGASIFSHVMCSSRVPSIYQDVKGECPNIDHPRWKNAIRWGRAAHEGWPSMRWNPFQEVFDDPEIESAAMTLASLLIPDGSSGDSWVAKLARPILAKLIISKKWQTPGEFADEVMNKSLQEILQMGDTPGGLMALLGGKNVPEYISAEFLTNMNAFRIGWGREVTSGHDFTLDQLIDNGGYVLSAEADETLRLPIRMLWAMLLRRLMRSVRPRPLNILLDEAVAAGKIPDVLNALVTLRNRKVSIWMGFQSVEAIEEVYEKKAKALADAFGNRIYLLRNISPRDAKQLSENMRSWSKERGGHVGLSIGSSGPSLSLTSGTDDITALPLLSAEDIETRGHRNEYWAVVSGHSISKSGYPILVQTVAGDELTRRPEPGEAVAPHLNGGIDPHGKPFQPGPGMVTCGHCKRPNHIWNGVCDGCGAPLEVPV